MSPICVQVVVIVTCSQLFFAGAFAAFIPDANDVLNDVDYDITQPNIEQIDENKLFRALSHVVLGYLKSERESLNDYLGQKLEGHYYPITNQESSSSGLKRMPVVDKRKVFWQPLGYLPPGSVHVNTNSNSGSSSNSRGQVFRYG